jgi:hypothetical protein
LLQLILRCCKALLRANARTHADALGPTPTCRKQGTLSGKQALLHHPPLVTNGMYLVVCVLTCRQQLRCKLSRHICWCLQQGRHSNHSVS